ncbi:hypothetical protein C8R44DRAFT_734712 [Mycena epipterygia]|nr:hypothetical protein C8R44DRAFT_734712 [Mycena epipterygia]
MGHFIFGATGTSAPNKADPALNNLMPALNKLSPALYKIDPPPQKKFEHHEKFVQYSVSLRRSLLILASFECQFLTISIVLRTSLNNIAPERDLFSVVDSFQLGKLDDIEKSTDGGIHSKYTRWLENLGDTTSKYAPTAPGILFYVLRSSVRASVGYHPTSVPYVSSSVNYQTTTLLEISNPAQARGKAEVAD